MVSQDEENAELGPAAGCLVSGKRICVAGAGIAGTAFAVSLRRLCSEQGVKPPQIHLYERDEAPDARGSYSLSVRGDLGGLQVLQRLGLVDALMKYKEPGDGFHIARHTFKPLVRAVDIPLPGSKLRAALRPEEQKAYLGVCMISGRTGPLEKLPPQIEAGQWRVMSPTGTGLFVSPLERECAQWNLSFRAPESLCAELNERFRDPKARQEYLDTVIAEKGKPFAEPWPTLLCKTDLSYGLSASNPSDKLPHRNRAPVVFIGDACHPMNPFSGSGANMALVDGLQLAQQLMDPVHRTLSAAVESYDDTSGPRVTRAIMAGRKNIALAHSRGWQQLKFVVVYFIAGWIVAIKAWLKGLQA
ncbi:hypothetical protein WJX73_003740 [Symbiochloris irregularis]|uniref:FAD-binding domain-containing protein n=1 Tax=Symbiochloris irregularis TaxID=706552 RepID=A0AAW1NUB9_9CHLO